MHVKLARRTGCAVAVALGLGTGAPALSETLAYEAILNDISGLGGSGRADLSYDTDSMQLSVDVSASGFAPDMLHVQHIHGRLDDAGAPVDSVSPTLADDADGDGVVELLEGVPRYGPILLSLLDEEEADDDFMGFPSAPGGEIAFSATYDLTSTGAFNQDLDGDGTADDPATAAQLLPLDLREIVIHGAFLDPGIGGVGNEEPDPETGLIPGGYSAFVPVAAGEIRAIGTDVAPIPLPAAAWLMLAGIGGLGGLRLVRRSA